MTGRAFQKLALSLPEVHQEPHFHRASFRVGKKIFATMVPDGSEAMVRVRPLRRVYQLLSEHPEVFFDHKGWTWRNGSVGIRPRPSFATHLQHPHGGHMDPDEGRRAPCGQVVHAAWS